MAHKWVDRWMQWRIYGGGSVGAEEKKNTIIKN